MATFEDAYVKVKDIVEKAGKKTGQALELQKLRISAADLRSKVNKAYAKLGKSVYLSCCDGMDRSLENQQIIDEINIKMRELEDMENTISEYRNRTRCKACDFVNIQGAVFCSKCGGSMDQAAPAQAAPAQDRAEPEAPLNDIDYE